MFVLAFKLADSDASSNSYRWLATCRCLYREANLAIAVTINMAHWSTFEKETERETKKLIRCIGGIEDEEDQNFQLALKFAWSNFR